MVQRNDLVDYFKKNPVYREVPRMRVENGFDSFESYDEDFYAKIYPDPMNVFYFATPTKGDFYAFDSIEIVNGELILPENGKITIPK